MTDETENWLSVKGFEGFYEVSDLGRVKSLARIVSTNNRTWRVKERILVLGLTRKGYLFVSLHKAGKGYPKAVHRIVCETFHGPCPEGMETAHGDGNRVNARATNLSWKTRKANHADKLTHGTHLFGEAVPGAKLNAESAREVYTLAHSGKFMRVIAREYGVSEAAVRQIRAHKLWASETLALRSHLMGGSDRGK